LEDIFKSHSVFQNALLCFNFQLNQLGYLGKKEINLNHVLTPGKALSSRAHFTWTLVLVKLSALGFTLYSMLK
jgi:hypothetical protein